MQRPDVVLRDYSQRPIPIGAKVELEVEWQGNRVTAPIYLRSDSIVRGEPLLLGTNVVIPLGLMVPGPGVKPREAVPSQSTGQEEPDLVTEEQPLTVHLVCAERVPARADVGVDAVVRGMGSCPGPLLFEPSCETTTKCLLDLEDTVVHPDLSGHVQLVLRNPTGEALSGEYSATRACECL